VKGGVGCAKVMPAILFSDFVVVRSFFSAELGLLDADDHSFVFFR